MKVTWVIVAWVSAWAVSQGTDALAQAAVPDIDIDVTIDVSDKGAPNIVRGEMRIRGWPLADEGCFYLPYEDETYGEERGTKRRFEAFSARGEALHFGGGSLEVEPLGPVRVIGRSPPQVLRLGVPAQSAVGGEWRIKFVAKVPRLPNMDPDDWFYEGFLPQPLRTCPSSTLDPEYYRTALVAHYRGTIRYPGGWQYVGPGAAKSGAPATVSIDETARIVAFALGRKMAHRTMRVGDVPVEIFYHSQQFADMAASVERVLPVLVEQFGPYPYSSLKILETTELQTHGLPGIIAINRPAQTAFSQAQTDWLRWREWILTVQLARQWYGGLIAPASPDDEWLTTAIADFATLEALASDPQDFNLFSARADGSRLLSFDYRQFAEISAATLMNKSPLAVLTTSEFLSKEPLAKQNPLLFIKQVFALRQWQNAAGVEPFRAFLRNLTRRNLGGFLSPVSFLAELKAEPSPFSPVTLADLEASLTQWWTSPGWPNFALRRFDVEKMGQDKFNVQLSAAQLGSVDYRPLFAIVTDGGPTQYVRAEPVKKNDQWVASAVVTTEPSRGVVDPTREAFDSDRFDNGSDWPGVNFIPGTANTLSDEDYTVGWFPYAFRRPGEPFSFGAQVALLKYLQSGLFMRVETAPSEKVAAVEARETFQAPARAVSGMVAIKQNYDHEREAEVSVSRFPFVAGDPQIGLGIKLRHKEQAGMTATAHQTGAFSLLVKPAGRSRVCGYQLEGGVEHAPEALAHGFAYERNLGIASVDCNLTRRISIGLRWFAGYLSVSGDVPKQAYFKPTDLHEARLRLDLRGLSRVRKLTVIGADLMLPFYVPIPNDAMLLARQMRWRLFYDHGRADDLGIDYRSHGVGFTLPFGGDLAGAGSLAFTRISVLAILGSRAGEQVRRKPSFVLDVTGEL